MTTTDESFVFCDLCRLFIFQPQIAIPVESSKYQGDRTKRSSFVDTKTIKVKY